MGEAPPFDPYGFVPPPSPGRASVEGDRLLGLIRDHGRNPLRSAWRGEPCPPDGGFGYGGVRGYPSAYLQGGDFANFDHAGRLPPPVPLHDGNNDFGQGFASGGRPHEKYLDSADHRFHQFHPEAFPGAPLPPPLPPYAETDAVPPPPETPFPFQRDYRAVPPRPAANSSLFPVLSGSPAMTVIPPSSHTLPQAHPMPNSNCYDGHINDEVASALSMLLCSVNVLDGLLFRQKHLRLYACALSGVRFDLSTNDREALGRWKDIQCA